MTDILQGSALLNPADVFIGLGSNIGDRLQHLREAMRLIESLPHTLADSPRPPIAISGVYESEPLGYTEQESFYNAACHIQTLLSPLELFHALKKIERTLGRPEVYERWHPRRIDLDILLYGDAVIATDRLTIPHAELPNRKFVMLPLLEIADPLHPQRGKRISELLAETGDVSQLKRLNGISLTA